MGKRTLVIGASENVQRYSNMAIRKLNQFQHEVKAIGARKGEVDGVVIESELIPFEGIDTVTLYVNPKNHERFYHYIIGLKPHRVIFNPGTENPEFAKQLEAHQIQTEQACTLVLLNTKQY